MGKEVSAWMYRTGGWIKTHPIKTGAFMFGVAAFWIWYEANVVRKNKIVSPTVNNHLVYDVKKVVAADVNRQAIDDENIKKKQLLQDPDSPKRQKLTKAMIAQEPDPVKRAELQAIMDEQTVIDQWNGNSAMVVKSGQLYAREPHWNIRNNERNWVVMARDQQQQQDHYWYRSERSRDDDYARNTYSK